MNMNCCLFQQECEMKDMKEVKKPETVVLGKFRKPSIAYTLLPANVLPFEIVNIFSHLGSKEQILQNIFKNIEAEQKNEVKKVTGTEIFGGEVKKKKKHDEHVLETNLNTLHQEFYKHKFNENKDDKQNSLNILKFAKKKMMNVILGFTNNLVSENSLK